MTPKQRQKLETDWNANLSVNDEWGSAFRGKLREKDRDIAICREIATASKHVEVTQGPDETIDTVARAVTTGLRNSEGEQYFVDGHLATKTVWQVQVTDHGNRRELVDVIDKAFKFWAKFIDDRGIAK
jgi:hypothetical protein